MRAALAGDGDFERGPVFFFDACVWTWTGSLVTAFEEAYGKRESAYALIKLA